jgi:threonine dehydrogenase-like Zn-dependent dehydrogenase
VVIVSAGIDPNRNAEIRTEVEWGQRDRGARGCGPAPLRRYLPELIDRVLREEIDPGKAFDLTLPLEQAGEGYRAMDERSAIRTMMTT